MSADGPSFAGHPVSLAEVKANKSCNSAAWTPRDVLIAALREIDEGHINPDALLVAYSTVDTEEPGVTSSGYWVSSPNKLLTLGMIENTKHSMLS